VTALTGTGKLVRLILRRDRVLLPLWILTFGLLMGSVVASFRQLFPTASDRQAYAGASAADAAFTALYGPLHGSGLGELSVWRAGFYPVLIALIALLTVIRHTRTEEETGRRELLGATVVGRHAALAAALLVTLAANLVLAAAVAAAMAGQGCPPAGRSPPACNSPPPAGCSLPPGRWPPSSPAGPARPGGSPSASSAGPGCCGSSATSAACPAAA
jgi:ABC-2 type transport system permease protein